MVKLFAACKLIKEFQEFVKTEETSVLHYCTKLVQHFFGRLLLEPAGRRFLQEEIRSLI